MTPDRIEVLIKKVGPNKLKEVVMGPFGSVYNASKATQKMDRVDEPFRNLLIALGEGILAERYLFGQLQPFLPPRDGK